MAPSLFDDHGYQDVPNRETGTHLSAADDRTLRMAMPPVDGALLDALVRYQEAFLADVGSARGSEALARAHALAQTASGLDSQALEQGIAMLRAFGGRRWTARKLDDKLRQLEGASEASAEELRTRVRDELGKQERETVALGRRYGEATLALLREREGSLLDLHTRMTGLLSQG
ncbi:hypothetical protein HUA74_42165 [Myxococcus sp. CA051A]|uniref:Uncharacterized protein n=1 Tax=Myxococcus llanfairpwllgwyngyllgogerychwyrndrobwllllantysiliogogogochensis TaxID=2590453 RepID=A0A540WY26_9BACT|nr:MULTISPECIES: hypothetical protein [Myxococcus]NTX06633.1 hypothetical protein [Myxococcus sp. CA040A]NTX16896.1 hypothetical protein [Myxococcus sp. CA056]NTX67276.1 hypothetical protein [Myxococcus sp. CA051A]TQF13916.1 hypothetical protein FJV41_21545 [Myxococcus llanfairpwllgwyngyllgogerychwyrndrobwllllantysiliogogogochensis]